RAAAVAVHVLVLGVVFEGPEVFAGLALEGAEALAIADAVEDEGPTAANGRHGVTFAELHFPDEWRAVLRPGCENAFLGRDAVAVRPLETGPVDAGGTSAEIGRESARPDGSLGFARSRMAATKSDEAAKNSDVPHGGSLIL